MKTVFVFMCLSMVGCSENIANPPNNQSVQTDSGYAEAAVTSVSPDAGVDANKSYNACLTMAASQTTYARLTEHTCTDSNGVSYHYDYFDSKLSMSCKWRLTNDQKVHCVPMNESSSPEYADEYCTTALAFVAPKSDRPYIGLDTYFGDAGESFVTYYNVGDEYAGQKMYYSMTDEDGNQQCYEETPLNFVGVKMHYVGDTISPNIFVEKSSGTE